MTIKKGSLFSYAIKNKNKKFNAKHKEINQITHNMIHLGIQGGDRLFGTPKGGRGCDRRPTPKADRSLMMYSKKDNAYYVKHRIPKLREQGYVWNDYL